MTMAARIANAAQAALRDGKTLTPVQSAYMKVVKWNSGGDEFPRHEDDKALPQWNNQIALIPEALTIPIKWTKPRRIFVNSMTDLFHEQVPFDYIDKVFAVMALCPQHVFQVLTKRPERMAEYLGSGSKLKIGPGVWNDVAWAMADIVLSFPVDEGCRRWAAGANPYGPIDTGEAWPLPNVWLGTSTEDQKTADERIPHLLKCPAAVRFLSCEPLLGPVDLGTIPIMHMGQSTDVNILKSSFMTPSGGAVVRAPMIHWVIAGGESGHEARPMHPDWARELRDQCQAAGVAFHYKQWGEFHPRMKNGTFPDGTGEADHLPGCHLYRDGSLYKEGEKRGEVPVNMKRIGKHKAGRLLDGREWNEFPEVKS